MVCAEAADSASGGTEPVADVAPKLGGVLRRDIGIPRNILVQQVLRRRIDEVAFIGKRCGDSAGKVAEHFIFMKNRFTAEEAPDVGIDRVRDVVAGSIRPEALAGDKHLRAAEFGHCPMLFPDARNSL